MDLGVKTLATLSDGTTDPNPRHLRRRLKKLKRFQRVVSRRHAKAASNRRKAVCSASATCIAGWPNQRANTLHHLTSRLAKTKSVVVIEDQPSST